MRPLQTLKKYEMEADERQMGIVFAGWGWWCVYGYKHGHLRWAPAWLKSSIVLGINKVVCLLRGHDTTELKLFNEDDTWPEGRVPCCVNCSHPLLKTSVKIEDTL